MFCCSWVARAVPQPLPGRHADGASGGQRQTRGIRQGDIIFIKDNDSLSKPTILRQSQGFFIKAKDSLSKPKILYQSQRFFIKANDSLLKPMILYWSQWFFIKANDSLLKPTILYQSQRFCIKACLVVLAICGDKCSLSVIKSMAGISSGVKIYAWPKINISVAVHRFYLEMGGSGDWGGGNNRPFSTILIFNLFVVSFYSNSRLRAPLDR